MRLVACAALVAAAVALGAPAAAAERLLVHPALVGADDDLETYRVVGYRGGRPRAIQVVTLGWAEVEIGTARAFLLMRDAAAQDGVTLTILSGFRSHERQTWLYQAWRAGYGNPAARPGYSNHQSGRALDLQLHDPSVRPWLERHARRFGFRRTVAREPWHYEFTRLPRATARRYARSHPAPRATRPPTVRR